MEDLPLLSFFPQNVDTVQFSNEAFNDNSMMSFDNVLYGNVEDPVVMTPLEFPIDDKQPLPQVLLFIRSYKLHTKKCWVAQLRLHKISKNNGLK